MLPQFTELASGHDVRVAELTQVEVYSTCSNILT